jgi:hypothetical protein
MTKYSWLWLVVVFLFGCQKQHPIKVIVDPALKPAAIEKVAVLSFGSMLHAADDPDGEAPMMLEKYFMPQLDTRNDYNFIAPQSVMYAVLSLDQQDQFDKFLANWPTEKVPNMALLSALAERLGCDAFLIPVVDVWQKDEADYQENSTPATYVGATISLVDAKNGTVLFEATDEDYLEGARTETSDRSVVRGGSGSVKSDRGARTHKAPEFDGVIQKVVLALVASLPAR